MRYFILLFISLPAFAYTAKDYDGCTTKVETIRNTRARDISHKNYGVMLKGCNYMLPKFKNTSPVKADAPDFISDSEMNALKENEKLKEENAYLGKAYVAVADALGRPAHEVKPKSFEQMVADGNPAAIAEMNREFAQSEATSNKQIAAIDAQLASMRAQQAETARALEATITNGF